MLGPAEHRDVTRSLTGALPDWPELEDVPSDGGALPPEDGGLTAAEEAEIKDQLAALGYLE